MIDGGVFANNPTICAMVEAIVCTIQPISCLSQSELAVSRYASILPALPTWGDVFWALPMMSIFMTANSQTVSVETDELLGNSHWRLDVSLTTTTPEGETVNPDMDDASAENIKGLVDKANQLIDAERDRINDLAKELAVPKADVQPKGTRPEKGILLKLRTEVGV
jgi:hypothetical protein